MELAAAEETAAEELAAPQAERPRAAAETPATFRKSRREIFFILPSLKGWVDRFTITAMSRYFPSLFSHIFGPACPGLFLSISYHNEKNLQDGIIHIKEKFFQSF